VHDLDDLLAGRKRPCYLLAERALATGTVRGYVTLDQPLPFLLWSDQLKY